MSYLLGSDPELLLLNDGEVMEASEYGLDYQDAFGMDGAGTAAEIRPQPADCPLEAVDNIQETLIEGFSSDVGDFDWIAGTGRGMHPLGGHIHIGNTEGVDLYAEGAQRKIAIYVGLPLIAMEPEGGREERRRSGYGGLFDFRDQRHGMEYRAPSSWLVSPTTARIAMTLTSLVVNNLDVLPRPASIDYLYAEYTDGGYGREFDSDRLQAAAAAAMSTVLRLPAAKAVLGKTAQGKSLTARDVLRPWQMITQVLGDWNELRDIRKTWHLIPEREYSYVGQVLTEDKAAEGPTNDLTDDILWHEGHAHMSRVKGYCGRVGSGAAKMWVVGAKASRGEAVLLSPALFKNPDVQAHLTKRAVVFKQWPAYPRYNGDYVVGLPAEMRAESPRMCAEIVRCVALTAFGRITKQGRMSI